jgi:hypothetical protein
MERTELIANNLNLAFIELIYSPHFINNKNWDGFSEVVSNAIENGILFQLQSNDFYDLTSANPLEEAINIFSQLEEIQNKKPIIVKNQDYGSASLIKDEERLLIEKLRNLNFSSTSCLILFFEPVKKSIIQIKQFQNKSLNQMFLKHLNFNI